MRLYKIILRDKKCSGTYNEDVVFAVTSIIFEFFMAKSISGSLILVLYIKGRYPIVILLKIQLISNRFQTKHTSIILKMTLYSLKNSQKVKIDELSNIESRNV